MDKKIKMYTVICLILILCSSEVWAYTADFTLDSISDSTEYSGQISYVNGIYNITYLNGTPNIEYILYVINYGDDYLDYEIEGDKIEYIEQVSSDSSGDVNISFNNNISDNSIVILAGNMQKIVVGEIIGQSNIADVNEDGTVDMLDIRYAEQYYKTSNSRCDINNDSVVNILDIVFISKRIEN